MKTTKKLGVICLALIMSIVAVMPSTFSWYSHNTATSGTKISYERSSLPISGGTINVNTKEITGKDANGNLTLGDLANNTAISVSNDTTKYFKTTITNSNTSSDAMVGVYLSDITNVAGVYIGTTNPVINERNFSANPSLTLTTEGVKRIYFRHNNISYWKDDTPQIHLLPSSEIDDSDLYEFYECASEDSSGKTVYYYDIPSTTTGIYFCNGYYSDMDDNAYTQGQNRTETIKSPQTGVVYYLTGNNTSYNNKEYKTEKKENLISVNSYYNSLSMIEGQEKSVALTKGVNYTGYSAYYEPADVTSASYISVNGNTGVVTCDTKIPSNVTVKIKTTLTGRYEDTLVLYTTVVSPDTLDSVPVAQNIKVKKRAENASGELVDGKAEIYWYIKNKSGDTATFKNIYYTK